MRCVYKDIHLYGFVLDLLYLEPHVFYILFIYVCPPTDLIAHMKGKEQHQHACGRVASVVSGPVVVDVFEECWVEDLDLVEVRHPQFTLLLSFFRATNNDSRSVSVFLLDTLNHTAYSECCEVSISIERGKVETAMTRETFL